MTEDGRSKDLFLLFFLNKGVSSIFVRDQSTSVCNNLLFGFAGDGSEVAGEGDEGGTEKTEAAGVKL